MDPSLRVPRRDAAEDMPPRTHRSCRVMTQSSAALKTPDSPWLAVHGIGRVNLHLQSSMASTVEMTTSSEQTVLTSLSLRIVTH